MSNSYTLAQTGTFFPMAVQLLKPPVLFFFVCIGSQLWHMGSSLRCAGSFVVAHGLFVAALGFSLVVACRFSLSSCDAWGPEHLESVVCGTRALSLRCANSVVVVCRLSSPAAYGILVPQPGIEPTSPALEGRFFTNGPPGKSHHQFFKWTIL